MDFLQGSIDFFLHKKTAHMGAYQYVHHAGMRDGKSVSGATLWQEIEEAEYKAVGSNLFSSDEILIRKTAHNINLFLPEGTPIVEMGPGTPRAFCKKTLMLMMSLRSLDYTCIDESEAFLSAIKADPALSSFNVKTIQDDFFEGSSIYYNHNKRPALACLLGGTIGNMPAPICSKPPQKELVACLLSLVSRIQAGWLLISFDNNQDGEELKEYYTNHTLFHLNVFDRMAVELPINGNFDPCAFYYEPQWIASSGQMAHMAVATKSMTFELGNTNIQIKEGQCLHLKNSFKFTPEFFLSCCKQAGLALVNTWDAPDNSGGYCLLKKNPPNQP